MTAIEVARALARRHTGDIFVSECKDGPTQTRAHRRLDAWAMTKTWSPITTFGYEIKVTRADFLNDGKIAEYLPLCHYLYVVTPKGLIDKTELPEHVGLIEVIGGGRTVIRHKASYRVHDISPMMMLLFYVLMCRAQITRETKDSPEWRSEALRLWLASKDDKRQLSYAVNGKIAAMFADQEQRFATQQRELEQLQRVKQRIVELGFNPDEPLNYWNVETRLKELAGNVKPILMRLNDLTNEVSRVKASLERYIQPSVGDGEQTV